MSNAVDTLEAVFENAECKLNTVICQIERCFANYDNYQAETNDSLSMSSSSMNPVKLISEMKEISKDLDEIKNEHVKLVEYEKETARQLTQDMESAKLEIQSVLKSLKNS